MKVTVEHVQKILNAMYAGQFRFLERAGYPVPITDRMAIYRMARDNAEVIAEVVSNSNDLKDFNEDHLKRLVERVTVMILEHPSHVGVLRRLSTLQQKAALCPVY